MTENTILIAFTFVAWIICFCICLDVNRLMKRARNELEEIGFEFDEKGNMK